MNRLMHKCKNCQTYTFETKCPKCGTDAVSPHPPKFSPEDRYLRYRMPERYTSAEIAEKKQ